MSASFKVQQRGLNVFVVVTGPDNRIVHWTNSRRRALRVVKQMKSRSKAEN